MANEFAAGKHGAIVAIPFSVANAVATQTNIDLVMAGGGTLAIMPKKGSVVGLSARATADLTAGSFTLKAHKSSTEFPDVGAPTLTLDDTNQKDAAAVRPGILTFAAEDGVGVSYSSSTDVAPTNTNDLDALLFVQLDPNA